MKQDRWIAMAILSISLIFFIMSYSIVVNVPDYEAVGSKGVPLFLSIVMIVLSLMLLIRPTNFNFGEYSKKGFLKQMIFLLMLLVYSILLEEVGFIIGNTAFMMFTMIFFGAKKYVATLISIIVTLSFYILFNILLGLTLPDGILAGIIT